MGDSDTELIKGVVHYQQCLEKYTRRNNEPRMLYCIGKLYKMPITVEHLEQTGVGRTVNSLRKVSGEVGEAAKSLVAKWKEMVVGEDNESKDASIKSESSKSHKEEPKSRKHKEGSSSSSHKESDKRNKHESKEKNSSFSNGEEPHSKKVKEESKNKKLEENYKKYGESNHYKYKSSKQEQGSDDSESDDNEYEKAKTSNHRHKSSHKSSKRKQDSDNSESDDSEYKKSKNSSHKHKSSKQKIEENLSENESRYKAEKDKRDNHKQKSSKRKREDSDYDDEEYEEVNIKHKKYSEDEESESEVEEKEVKSHSHKYQSKHKDELKIIEKNKHSSHKYKDKKEKNEYLVDDKPKKSVVEHKAKYSSKEKVKSSSEKREKEENDKKSKQSSKHHRDKEHKSSKKSSSHSSKSKVPVHENGIGSGSGTSFAEALGMLEPSSSKPNKKKIAVIHPFPKEKTSDANTSSPDISKAEVFQASDLLTPKKLEPLDINISNLLPEITPNYRPLGNFSVDSGQSKNKITTDEEALSAIIYSKISRTKVYSGNKVIWGKVPTLFDLCTHVLQDNIDALEYTGGVPYSILKPVIERANPDQLFLLEHHNPYLIEDTDELWQLHCQKEFRNKRREEMETWRDMYMRCLDEREAKLKALTANIKQSQDKSLPVRQTKLAYVDGHSIVKPPRSIARKQAKHGTAGVEKKPLVTPSSRLSALATAGAAGQIAVPNPGARAAAAGSSSAVIKPKKAPLMQKTLAFMKNRLFRR